MIWRHFVYWTLGAGTRTLNVPNAGYGALLVELP
jgi:hypothetical protein